ncbi:DUF4238 domain-containing protein [Streptomyces sp. NBC_00140]|uniref:DUF4238 domain-containing protein n=1 Tax=Streptomyces sp. NBC_00140 TaxID=2975664 RepID=UPI00225202C0|nr:DUF4238 domain-containing protein [Streptomyces sp. NBC_00140]MCX5327841.1 DUF4238 domain-containing protein [Streptomyces sp. NBC_00140]
MRSSGLRRSWPRCQRSVVADRRQPPRAASGADPGARAPGGGELHPVSNGPALYTTWRDTTHPKKHHFIPQFLLQHFAGQRAKLVIHQVMSERRFNSTVRDVGHRNLGHSVYWPGREPDHVSMEAAMCDIEGEAATAVRELMQDRARAIPNYARHALAWLLALQWPRSRFLMHVLAKGIGAEDGGLSNEEFQTHMMTMVSRSVIEPWHLRNDDDAHYKNQWNPLAYALLASDMHWSCYRPRGGGLLVSDNPVCLSGVVGTPPPGIPVGFFNHGVATGFHGFRRLTVPLASGLAVIISRDPQDSSRLRAADINRFTVFNSREFVAHAPEWPKSHPRLAQDLPYLLETQRMVAPAFLQDYAPGGRA